MKDINLPDKIYYKISDVATAFSLPTSTIRFWEKEFDILRPKKNKKGDRLFTKEDVKNLKTIYYLLKKKGYTIEGAKTHLSNNKKEIELKIEVLGRLQSLRSELVKLKEALEN